MRTLLAVATIVLVTACGGGGAPEPTAGAFVQDLFTRMFEGRYASVWEDLYPPHQKVATRDRYVTCSRREPAVPEPIVEVLGTRDEEWRVSGEDQPRPSAAVTFRITVEGSKATNTGHLIDVDGRWRWILSRDDYEAFAAGRCP